MRRYDERDADQISVRVLQQEPQVEQEASLVAAQPRVTQSQVVLVPDPTLRNGSEPPVALDLGHGGGGVVPL